MTLAAIVLLVGGIILILSEFLLPGGILGALGVFMVIGSAALGIYQYPGAWLLIVLSETLFVSIALAVGFFNITKGPWGKLLVNETEQRAEDGYINTASPVHLMGRTGVVLTALRPAGTILVDHERYDAVADGAFIDKDATVRVIEVHGNRIVVEPAEPSPAQEISA